MARPQHHVTPFGELCPLGTQVSHVEPAQKLEQHEESEEHDWPLLRQHWLFWHEAVPAFEQHKALLFWQLTLDLTGAQHDPPLQSDSQPKESTCYR